MGVYKLNNYRRGFRRVFHRYCTICGKRFLPYGKHNKICRACDTRGGVRYYKKPTTTEV